MHCPDDGVPSRGIHIRRSREESGGKREKTCKAPGDVVLSLVAAIGHKKNRDGTQTADKNVAHHGVVVTAYRALNSGAFENDFSDCHDERKGDADNTNGFPKVEV